MTCRTLVIRCELRHGYHRGREVDVSKADDEGGALAGRNIGKAGNKKGIRMQAEGTEQRRKECKKTREGKEESCSTGRHCVRPPCCVLQLVRCFVGELPNPFYHIFFFRATRYHTAAKRLSGVARPVSCCLLYCHCFLMGDIR